MKTCPEYSPWSSLENSICLIRQCLHFIPDDETCSCVDAEFYRQECCFKDGDGVKDE